MQRSGLEVVIFDVCYISNHSTGPERLEGDPRPSIPKHIITAPKFTKLSSERPVRGRRPMWDVESKKKKKTAGCRSYSHPTPQFRKSGEARQHRRLAGSGARVWG